MNRWDASIHPSIQSILSHLHLLPPFLPSSLSTFKPLTFIHSIPFQHRQWLEQAFLYFRYFSFLFFSFILFLYFSFLFFSFLFFSFILFHSISFYVLPWLIDLIHTLLTLPWRVLVRPSHLVSSSIFVLFYLFCFVLYCIVLYCWGS